MKRGSWLIVLAVVATGFAAPASAVAVQQSGGTESGDATGGEVREGWQPTVYAYFLRGEGEEVLDPFGSDGRREVLQLMMMGTPQSGQFSRVRLDRMDAENEGRETGWYEIRGEVITLYHMDERGATGRVEHGRYMHGRICFVDTTSGRTLSYVFLPPEGVDLVPPPSEGAPDGGACETGARPTS